MIAGRLTMRAQVERNAATARDNWGNPVAPDFQAHGDPLPCFVWAERSAELVDGKKAALIGDYRGLFPLGADLAEDDELAAITDRAGTVLIAGRLRVEGPIQYMHTHLEVQLRRVS